MDPNQVSGIANLMSGLSAQAMYGGAISAAYNPMMGVMQGSSADMQ